MNLENFATKYRLKTRRSPDDENELVVNGKQGQVYEYSNNELAVSFMPGLVNGRGVGTWCPKRWSNIRRNAETLGMTLRQNGDSEGSLSFDPLNREQAKLAIQIARARQKRQMSPEAKAKLVNAGLLTRKLALEQRLGR
jgi:hypothetical protein